MTTKQQEEGKQGRGNTLTTDNLAGARTRGMPAFCSWLRNILRPYGKVVNGAAAAGCLLALALSYP
jgi:hypothetical protein